MQDEEVSESIDLLDRVAEGGVGGEEPRVFGGYEVVGEFGCPELEVCVSRRFWGMLLQDMTKRTLYPQSGLGLKATHVCRTVSQSEGRVSLLGSFQLWKIWWMILGMTCGRGSGVVELWAIAIST